MSEQKNTGVEKTIQELLDPSFEEAVLIGHVRRVNKLSENGDLEKDELARLVPAFDEEWPYHDGLLQAYGRVTSVESGESILLSSDGQPVVSFGFSLNETEGVCKIGYYLGAVDLKENTIEEIFWADVDELHIDTSMRMDGVRATHLLGHFYPDAIDEIDERYFEAQSDVEFVLSLRNFLLDHNKRGHPPEDADSDEIRTLLTETINHQVPLATTVPWSVAFKGMYFPARQNLFTEIKDAEVEDEWQRRLALPVRIVMLPEVKTDEAGYSHINRDISRPAISLHVYPICESESPEGELITVPITDDLRIASNIENVEMFEDLEDY